MKDPLDKILNSDPAERPVRDRQSSDNWMKRFTAFANDVKRLDNVEQIGFVIHHSASQHWILGFAMHDRHGSILCIHNGIPQEKRSEGI